MIDEVEDVYGDKITFDYNASQQFGRWSISQITLPTTGTITFSYTDGFFSGASCPDGTSSTVTFKQF